MTLELELEDARTQKVELEQELDREKQARRVLEQELQALPGKRQPLFSTGQGVMQWWTRWFKDATTPKTQYNKKNGGPAWYIGEITNPPEYVNEMLYAGMPFTGWAYPTY